MKRKLAAIMFTDITGYTSIMSVDEGKALAALEKQRNLFKPIIEKYQGEWLKEMGDGTLSCFHSASEAVKCAIEIQRALETEADFKVRIGIHIGDVVFSEGDVYGDGVNIASRIEPVSEPGGICVSESVYEHLANKPEYHTEFVGEKKLKNVPRPVKVYSVSTTGKQIVSRSGKRAGKSAILRKWKRYLVYAILSMFIIAFGIFLLKKFPIKSKPDEKKVLLVLPFENLGNPEDEYFADGITEEIISRLAQLRELGVISRTTAISYKNTDKSLKEIGAEVGVDYILEGTIRWDHSENDKGRIRVTPQLIHVEDDVHLWADRFDSVLEDVFSVQTQIAEKVVHYLDITLVKYDIEVLKQIPTTNIDAYEYYLKGIEYYNKSFWYSDLDSSIVNFRKAVEIDSNFAQAYAKMSMACSKHYNLFAINGQYINEAKEAVEKADKLAPESPDTYIAYGYYYSYCQNDYDMALKQFESAFRLSPNSAATLEAMAFIQGRLGDFNKSISNMKKALKLNPNSRMLLDDIGSAYQYLRKFDEAEVYFEKAIEIAPDWDIPVMEKALNCICKNGDIDKAREIIDEGMKRVDNPDAILKRFYGMLLSYEGKFSEALSITEYPTEKASYYYFMGEDSMAALGFEDIKANMEYMVNNQPNSSSNYLWLGIAYAGLGRKDEAIESGLKGVELNNNGPAMYQLAFIYVMTGEYDKAIDQLEYILEIPSYITVPFLKLEPLWIPIREHPRFIALLEKYGNQDR